ncbi:O-antigen ligase family protein [Fructobacillus papyrifericola]|nr:hypothetical protein [Fructobacillus papyrifericola]
MIAFPLFVIFILVQLFRYPSRLKSILPSKAALTLTGFFWVMQIGSMLVSYSITGETILTMGIIHSGIILFTWTLTVYVAWATIQLSINSERDERQFIKSGLVALGIYLVVVILPQIFVTLNIGHLNSYVNHLAKLFERHWQMHGPNYDFYRNGSYVTSEHRVNGFEPEAAFLANLVGVAYLPLLIGLTAAKSKIWGHTRRTSSDIFLNSVFAISIFGVLLLAKTTTGILTACIAYLLWIFWSKGKGRWSLIFLAAFGILMIVFAYFKVGVIHNLLNQFLFAKGGTDNRLGGTIGLLLTFLTHPIFGVGYGFTSYFIIKNVPESTTHNFEFQHVYSQFGYPNLSDLLGWFASFGLVIMIPAIWLLCRLVARSYLVKYRVQMSHLSDDSKRWNQAMMIAFITMIILAAFSSIFVIQVFLWPYLLMFFFYRKHIMRLEQELQP